MQPIDLQNDIFPLGSMVVFLYIGVNLIPAICASFKITLLSLPPEKASSISSLGMAWSNFIALSTFLSKLLINSTFVQRYELFFNLQNFCIKIGLIGFFG